MKKRIDAPLILCDDYGIGKFTPISFIPKLNWKITCSEFIEHPTVFLPRVITIVGRLGQYNIQISSKPYSYGVFHTEC